MLLFFIKIIYNKKVQKNPYLTYYITLYFIAIIYTILAFFYPSLFDMHCKKIDFFFV